MNAPRHGHTDSGNGGGVLIGCVAFAVVAFSLSLGAAVYFWALRPIDGAVLPPPAVAYPTPTSSAPPAVPVPVLPPSAPLDPLGPTPPTEPTLAPLDPGLVPAVETGEAEVRGSLDRDAIRRVIRRHINEVRYCYEQGLRTEPTLSGRITVEFIVSPTGAVQVASVADSNLGDSSASAAVAACILTTVRRWVFPAPAGGGIVAITYPFVLTSN